ncbi:MAG: hypothetical protein ACPLXM_04070 [Bacteroidales bacterium]
MTIDLQRTAIKIRLRGLLMAVLFVCLVCVVLFLEVFRNPVFGLTRAHYILIISILYVLYSLYMYLLDLNYIYFNDDGQKIIFRYYSMRPLSQVKSSVEIPKESFAGYEIRKDLLGLVPKIVLYQRDKAGLFRYPPVSISSLSEKEKNLLLRSLQKYGGR